MLFIFAVLVAKVPGTELALSICLIKKWMNFRSGEADNVTYVASIHTFPPVTLSHENFVCSPVLSFLQYKQFKFSQPKAVIHRHICIK